MDGSPAVDQIAHPDDTAEGFVLAIERYDTAKNNVFNIAAPSPFRYQDFIERVAAELGKVYDRAKVRGFEPYAISNEKARRLLGYNPKYTMQMMIEMALRADAARS